MRSADLHPDDVVEVEYDYGGRRGKARIVEVGLPGPTGWRRGPIRDHVRVEALVDFPKTYGPAIEAGSQFVVATRKVIARWTAEHDEREAARERERAVRRRRRERLAAVGFRPRPSEEERRRRREEARARIARQATSVDDAEDSLDDAEELIDSGFDLGHRGGDLYVDAIEVDRWLDEVEERLALALPEAS